MNKTKLLKYFASEKGRTLVFYGTFVVGVTTFTLQYVPHTILVYKLQEFMQSYRNGIECDVSAELKRRFDIALEKCDCTPFEKKYLKPFTIVGFDIYHIGSAKSRFNGRVGLPTNYFYNSVNDIERSDIQLRSEPIDWSTETGKRLQESLILTENEQIFGMARSVLELKTHHLLIKSLFAPFTVVFVYGIGHNLNTARNLFARPLGMRLVLYSLLGLFGTGIYSFLRDFTQVYYETCADEYLASLGPDMIKAGIGFYDKLLQKNIAIRNMLGNEEYTANGNVNYFLRQKSLPLTSRKKFFETKLNEYNQLNNLSEISS